MKKLSIIHLCNSKIGKIGNIGLRTAKIITLLNSNNINNFSVSRNSIFKSKNYFTYGFFSQIPSVLNYIRTKFFKNFDHKYYDLLIFKIFINLYIKKIKIDSNSIIHVWDMIPEVLLKLKKKGSKIVLDVPIAPFRYSQTISDELYPKYNDEQSNLIISAELKSFNLADIILAPSIFVKNEIMKYNISSNKIKIIEFGADIDCFEKSFTKQISINFCFAGLINNRKGIKYLLKAWSNPIFKNDKLHLCGRVSSEIRDLLIEYNKFDNIILPGFVDTSEYFKRCDIYIFPSLLEGSSKSVYEAMNRSLPIICTFESGSIVTNNVDGFIVEKQNSEILKEKMIYFKENPSEIKIMGVNAKKNIKKYSWNRYSENILKVYNSLN